MIYIDQLKYEEYSKDPDGYISRANVINFVLIYAQCRGDKQENSNRFYQTVKGSDLHDKPEKEKVKTVSTCLRSDRPDVFCREKVNA